MTAGLDQYPTGYHSDAPPLRIPVEHMADMVCMFAHPWQDQYKIRRTIQSWDGREIGPEELEQLREWEQKPGWALPKNRSRHIPAPVRAAVMERDEGTCQACGSTENPTIDHIKPFSRGGRHTAGNLRVLCHSCNSSKRDRMDSEWGGVDG